MKILDLKQKRAEVVANMRSLAQKSEQENRDFNTEERSSFDKMVSDEKELRSRIERLESIEGVSKVIEEGRSEFEQTSAAGQMTYDQAFAALLSARSENQLTPEARQLLDSKIVRETRAEKRVGLLEGTNSAGGYTVARGFMNTLFEAVKFFGGILNAGVTFLDTETGAAIDIPTVNDSTSEATILGEMVADSDTSVAFGNASLGAFKYTSGVLPVSWELMQDSAFDLQAYIAKWLGERVGRRVNRDVTVGTGSGQPAGVIPNAATILAASATVITQDDLMKLKYSVDATYRQNGKYMLNDAVWSSQATAKDTTGRFLINGITIGTSAGQPDTLFGHQVIFNNVMDGAPAANDLVAAFGDFSSVIVRRVLPPTLVRFDELYKKQYATGFSVIARYDSKYVNPGSDPIKVLKMAAS